MGERKYISVIVPLRLEWEPCYWTTEDVAVGQAVSVPLGNREYVGVVGAVGIAPTLPPARIREIVRVEKEIPGVSAAEIELWRRIADYYMCSVGEVCKAARPLGKIRSERVTARRKKTTGKDRAGRTPTEELRQARERLRLTPAQLKAEEEILAAFSRGRTALLCGVTGSGKTEIYMSLAIRALEAGRNVLCLVPEIALSRQLEDRMRAVFGDLLLVYHSGETAARRQAVVSAVRSAGKGNRDIPSETGTSTAGNGSDLTENASPDCSAGPETRPYVVLGTRSAVFLPHHDLGLIVVDEEQDSSYKQDAPAPRYNGRDVALMLGAMQNGPSTAERCSVVLGSATPSLESVYNCLSGKYSEVRLSQRYYGTESADVELIDTNAERRKRGMRGSFSLKLVDRIRKCIENGEQVMILRARRGYAPVLQCSECGHILRCPRCNVSLTFHRDFHAVPDGGVAGKAASEMAGKDVVGEVVKAASEMAGKAASEMAGKDSGRISPGRAVCHHCGYGIEAPTRCPECGGEIYALGAGTQKIEEEAAALFPGARIARLDSDVMQSGQAGKDVIGKFSKGETDILIGTQMVTKGFDFGNLALVAVLQSDTLLGVRDFRADEKALQTLVQFRGRCGRRDRRGLLVIQTAQPDHPVYAGLMNTAGNAAYRPVSMENADSSEAGAEPADIDGQRTAGEGNAGQDEFRNALLAERKEFGYPPFTRQIVITLRHGSENAAESLAGKLAAALSDFRADGPYSPPLDREAGQFVRAVRVTLDRDRELAEHKRDLLRRISAFELLNGCPGAVTIDVDPV